MKEEKPVARGRDWKWYLSVFMPVALLIGFAIVFSGSSSSSDCGGDSDCSSSPADLSAACGAPANVDKSGTIRILQPLSIKSGQTDIRCGYGVSWSYSWSKEKKPPTTPNVTISVTAPKSGSSKANKSDTGGAGTYNVARGNVSGKDPVLGIITVTASYSDASLLDSANVTLYIVYSTIKK